MLLFTHRMAKINKKMHFKHLIIINLRKSLRLPFNRIAPSTPVVLKPDKASRRVDLPAPDGPIIAINWLPGNFPFTLCRISLSPETEIKTKIIVLTNFVLMTNVLSLDFYFIDSRQALHSTLLIMRGKPQVRKFFSF